MEPSLPDHDWIREVLADHDFPLMVDVRHVEPREGQMGSLASIIIFAADAPIDRFPLRWRNLHHRHADGRMRIVLRTWPNSAASRVPGLATDEVILMQHMLGRTRLPIPEVLARSVAGSQAPYVLMEWLPGVGLDQVWTQLDEKKKCNIMQQLSLAAEATKPWQRKFDRYQLSVPPARGLVAISFRRYDGGLMENVSEVLKSATFWNQKEIDEFWSPEATDPDADFTVASLNAIGPFDTVVQRHAIALHKICTVLDKHRCLVSSRLNVDFRDDLFKFRDILRQAAYDGHDPHNLQDTGFILAHGRLPLAAKDIIYHGITSTVTGILHWSQTQVVWASDDLWNLTKLYDEGFLAEHAGSVRQKSEAFARSQLYEYRVWEDRFINWFRTSSAGHFDRAGVPSRVENEAYVAELSSNIFSLHSMVRGQVKDRKKREQDLSFQMHLKLDWDQQDKRRELEKLLELGGCPPPPTHEKPGDVHKAAAMRTILQEVEKHVRALVTRETDILLERTRVTLVKSLQMFGLMPNGDVNWSGGETTPHTKIEMPSLKLRLANEAGWARTVELLGKDYPGFPGFLLQVVDILG